MGLWMTRRGNRRCWCRRPRWAWIRDQLLRRIRLGTGNSLPFAVLRWLADGGGLLPPIGDFTPSATRSGNMDYFFALPPPRSRRREPRNGLPFGPCSEIRGSLIDLYSSW